MDRKEAFDGVRDALDAAKAFAIRYPHDEAAKLIRILDNARVLVIDIDHNIGVITESDS